MDREDPNRTAVAATDTVAPRTRLNPNRCAPALVLLLAITVGNQMGSAQRLPQRPVAVHGPRPLLHYAVMSSPVRASAPDTVNIRPTHWKTGALIGGLIGGAALAYLMNGFCELSETATRSCGRYAIGGFLLGGTFGGTIGALIGGAFPVDNAASGTPPPD